MLTVGANDFEAALVYHVIKTLLYVVVAGRLQRDKHFQELTTESRFITHSPW